MPITVKLDTRELERYLGKLATELPKQLQNAVNKAARDARTQANKIAQREIGVRRRGDLIGTVKGELARARPGVLAADWYVSRSTVNMGQLRPRFVRGRPLVVSTHRLTKGTKSFERGFVLNGLAFQRVAPGSHSSLKGAKQLRTTSVAALMSQEDSPVRQTWERVATERLAIETPLAVETAIARAG